MSAINENSSVTFYQPKVGDIICAYNMLFIYEGLEIIDGLQVPNWNRYVSEECSADHCLHLTYIEELRSIPIPLDGINIFRHCCPVKE